MGVIINLLLVLILVCFFYKDNIKDNFASITEKQQDMKMFFDKFIKEGNIGDGFEKNTNSGGQHVAIRIIDNDINNDKYIKIPSDGSMNFYSQEIGNEESLLKTKHVGDSGITYTIKHIEKKLYLGLDEDNGIENSDLTTSNNKQTLLCGFKLVDYPYHFKVKIVSGINIMYLINSEASDTIYRSQYKLDVLPLCTALKNFYSKHDNRTNAVFKNRIYENGTKTIADKCNITFKQESESGQLRDMGNYYDANYRLTSYINNKLENTDYNLNTMSNYLMNYSEDPKRYIQRDYVLNALDYGMDKVEHDKQNLVNNIAKQTEELFGNIPPQQHIMAENNKNYEAFSNYDSLITEEEGYMIYPQHPADFYGEYKIIEGQYKILDGLIFVLGSTEFIVKTQNGLELLNYKLSDIKPKLALNFPTTTIEIDINMALIKPDNKQVLDVPLQILSQKQRNLLYKLGLNTGKYYLYGSDGKYRLYNYNRTLICHLQRIKTNII